MLHSPKTSRRSTFTLSRSVTDLTNIDQETSVVDTSPTNSYITQRVNCPCSSNSPSSDYNTLKNMIESLMATQSERLDKLEILMLNINGQTSKIESTNSDIQKSLTFLSEKMSTIEAQIVSLEADRKSTAAELTVIQEKVDSFERFIKKTSIEIRNAPKRTNETKAMLYDTVCRLSKTLNLEISHADIRDVTRGPSKKEHQTSTITVEFSNSLTKVKYLAAAKAYNKAHKEKKLNSSHLGFPAPVEPIFVDELLTSASKRLFYLTRNFVKQNKFGFCWTTNDKIFYKENKDSPYYQIRSESHLNSIVTSNTN